MQPYSLLLVDIRHCGKQVYIVLNETLHVEERKITVLLLNGPGSRQMIKYVFWAHRRYVSGFCRVIQGGC